MNEEELRIINDAKLNKELKMDCNHQYSDAFYNEFIASFEPSKNKKILYHTIKRLFDLFVCMIMLPFLIIPFVITAIAIKSNEKGPVFFRNRRVGKDGKIFNCLKFRTMSMSAPPEVATSLCSFDSYITKVGHFLRKTSVDEIPQLINVVKGEMSLVGFRPVVPTEKKCNEMRERLGVFVSKPGITGYAQINGRDKVYYKNKCLLDAYYVKNANILLDLKIIFRTFFVICSGNGNNDNQ